MAILPIILLLGLLAGTVYMLRESSAAAEKLGPSDDSSDS